MYYVRLCTSVFTTAMCTLLVWFYSFTFLHRKSVSQIKMVSRVVDSSCVDFATVKSCY